MGPAAGGYPLDGLRVLDLSRVLSGPIAARMLSDMGADVVKLEPPDGDVTRAWGEVRHGLSGFYTQQNAGKRNVCIDLRAPGAVDLVRRLATIADVVIENFRPGVLSRLGLGWDDLSARNPRLVMLSISGFGQQGPDAHRQAYAAVIHGESGIIARQAAFDGRPPSDPMLSIADTNAGLHGLAAVLAALVQRERTGLGDHIDLSMLDSMLATDDYVHHYTDGFPVIRLGGTIWDGPEGPVLVAADFRYLWRQLKELFGLDDGVPTDADLADKIAGRRAAIAGWFASFADADTLHSALDTANLAWGTVASPEEAVRSASVVARGSVAEVDDRGGGTRRVVQSPYRFAASRSGVRGGAPRRGEHNAAVLADWLALGEEELGALAAAGVLLAEDA
ncbi:MAG TPA: CaiB/BaiF CoA-transferase family protein [Acidimicrobiales bacterium]|nr:CaiB/BaiF CoA-transferase family protein [Acidimicrobiales bacterium]